METKWQKISNPVFWEKIRKILIYGLLNFAQGEVKVMSKNLRKILPSWFELYFTEF